MAAVERWKNSSAARSSDYTQQTISMLEGYATEDKDRSMPPPRPALGGQHARAEEDLPAKLTSGGAYASQRQVQRYAIPMSDVIRRLHPGRKLRNDQAGRYPTNGEEYRA